MIHRIAITQRVVETEAYADPRDALSQDWSVFFARLLPEAAMIPVPNRPGALPNWVAQVNPELLVLSNGNDWGQAPLRDATEKWLVDWAVRRGTPVLGVCRGLQALNVIFGGTLTTDLKQFTGQGHVACEHTVRLQGSTFTDLNRSEMLSVNSYHNQGVVWKGLASCLTPFALADDGVIEGACHKVHPVLAVQWHPERPTSSQHFDTLLIKRLIDEGSFWSHAT